MKTAVMYGAGNIGRGFIGQVLHDSGYEVAFIDVNMPVVDALNERKAYTQLIVDENGIREVVIDNVRAVDGKVLDNVADEIANCEVMATSVGAKVLRFIAPNIAEGIRRRAAAGRGPLNILICENLMDAAEYLHGLLDPCFAEDEKHLLEGTGLVEVVIGRMVPTMSAEMQAGDITRIAVEPYCELPVDKDAFKGEIPDLVGLVPYSPFEFYIKRKLFLHNGGHAVCAYLGNLKGYEYIWQAIADPEIYETAKAAMNVSAQALIKKFGEGIRENVESNVVDLLFRFQNKALKDTIARVGADPVRKLRRNDRIVGAALFAMEQGVDPTPVIRGIVAGLKFDRAEDATAPEVQAALKEQGIDYVIEKYMGLAKDEPLFGMIKAAYEA
ncbi:MAG: mannitol dehydrogenase [Oscillospiraceae bacterium]|nr:mannitol dehydrogenase [Oscillospiraceae bacterium]